MSGERISDEEYRRIKGSWRAAAPDATWTNQRMVDACWSNLQAAAKLEAERRALYAKFPPGDPRIVGDPLRGIDPLGYLIGVAASDGRHWRAEMAFWRTRCAQDGPNVAVKVPGAWIGKRTTESKPVRPAPIMPPDPRLPREPGMDDEEVPF